MSQPKMPPEIKSVILQRIWKRVNLRNQNAIVGVFGGTGSGKSYTCLRLCSLLDSTFDESRIVFSARDFLHLLNSGNLRKGNAILWDESGVGIAARGWQSESNRAILDVLQSFRSSNLILFFSSPDMKFVDAGARRLFHVLAETKYIDRIKAQVVLKVFVASHGVRNQKDYFRYFVKVLPSGVAVQITDLRVGMPRPDLVAAYEAKKAAFLKELNIRLESRLVALDEPKKKAGVDALSAAKEIAANPKDYIGKWGGREILKWNLIAARYACGKPTALRIKALAEQQLEGGKE